MIELWSNLANLKIVFNLIRALAEAHPADVMQARRAYLGHNDTNAQLLVIASKNFLDQFLNFFEIYFERNLQEFNTTEYHIVFFFHICSAQLLGSIHT